MGKLKIVLKKTLVCLLMIFMLSSTVVGDYLDTKTIEVQATGIGISVLYALVEAVMASMGLSYSSTADVNNAVAGLNSSINAYPDFQYGNKSVFSDIKNAISNGWLSTPVKLEAETYRYLKNYLYNQFQGNLSSASDVTNPFADLDPGVETVRIDMSSLSNEDLFYGYPVKNSSGKDLTFIDGCNIYTAVMLVTELINNNGSATLNIYYFVPSSTSYVTRQDSVLDTSNTKRYFGYANVNGTHRGDVRRTLSLSLNYNNNYLVAPEYQTTGFIGLSSGSTSSTSSYFLPTDNVKNAVYKVYINKGTKIYDSYQDYCIDNFASIYKPKSKVYGLSSTAKPVEEDSATGVVSLPLSEESIAAKVEQAVNTAIAANPSISEDELNAAAADVIAAQNGTTDAVNENTKTLSTLLTSILATVRTLSDNVAKIANKAVTDGSSALKIDDIADQFKVIEGTGGSEEPPDEEPPKEPELWKWTPVGFEFVSFLKPVFEFFSEPLEIITASLKSIWTSIEAVPGNISSAFKEWVLPAVDSCLLGLNNIFTSIEGLPAKIAASISTVTLPVEVPEITLPEITLPNPIDYTNPLNKIISLLEQFFLIDTVAIGDALSGFDNVWKDKFPEEKIGALFKNFSFSSSFTYPVIKIQTPDIIKTYYSDEYIILVDFGSDMLIKHVKWARNIIRAMLWFAFALGRINSLKAYFHIG